MARFRDIKTLQKSPPSMPRSITISTTNATSTAALFSNKPEPLPWLSGVNLQLKRPRLQVLPVRPS